MPLNSNGSLKTYHCPQRVAVELRGTPLRPIRNQKHAKFRNACVVNASGVQLLNTAIQSNEQHKREEAMDEDKMITRSELAQRWRVSKSWVDKQMVIAPETLPPFVTIGRQTRFPIQEVIRWENERISRLTN